MDTTLDTFPDISSPLQEALRKAVSIAGRHGPLEVAKELRQQIIQLMAGFRPAEGDKMSIDLLTKNVTTDRGIDLELGLFTNVAPGASITAATLTEPTGTGYARITLTDANWTGAADTNSYALQTFTAGAGGWTGSIQGYFIVTKGITPRIMGIEVDSAGPYTLSNAGDTYDITPNMRAA